MSATMKLDSRSFDRLHKTHLDAVSDSTEFLLQSANRTVPIEEDTLERSGVATVDGQGKGAVSYDAPYAVRQHEDTRLHHDSGRRAKWLERTANEERNSITQFIAKALGRVAR